MRANQISQRWGELSRLRHLQMVGAEMAVGQALRARTEASAGLDTALAERDAAMAGWHAHLAMQILDPALLQAWRGAVTEAGTRVAAGIAALTQAGATLAARRGSWLAAQQHHELAQNHHRAMRSVVNRRREERALATVSDIMSQRQAQAQ